MVCLHHIPQIKKALGISGVQTSVFSWHSEEAQIDLIIDRKDQVVNLCEMKFSENPFAINKKYSDNLLNKKSTFKEVTKTSKAVFITMITTHGLKQNKYSYLAQNSITMNELFIP